MIIVLQLKGRILKLVRVIQEDPKAEADAFHFNLLCWKNMARIILINEVLAIERLAFLLHMNCRNQLDNAHSIRRW